MTAKVAEAEAHLIQIRASVQTAEEKVGFLNEVNAHSANHPAYVNVDARYTRFTSRPAEELTRELRGISFEASEIVRASSDGISDNATQAINNGAILSFATVVNNDDHHDLFAQDDDYHYIANIEECMHDYYSAKDPVGKNTVLTKYFETSGKEQFSMRGNDNLQLLAGILDNADSKERYNALVALKQKRDAVSHSLEAQGKKLYNAELPGAKATVTEDHQAVFDDQKQREIAGIQARFAVPQGQLEEEMSAIAFNPDQDTITVGIEAERDAEIKALDEQGTDYAATVVQITQDAERAIDANAARIEQHANLAAALETSKAEEAAQLARVEKNLASIKAKYKADVIETTARLRESLVAKAGTSLPEGADQTLINIASMESIAQLTDANAIGIAMALHHSNKDADSAVRDHVMFGSGDAQFRAAGLMPIDEVDDESVDVRSPVLAYVDGSDVGDGLVDGQPTVRAAVVLADDDGSDDIDALLLNDEDAARVLGGSRTPSPTLSEHSLSEDDVDNALMNLLGTDGE